MIMMLKWH